MKKCTYCGKEYKDPAATVCVIDHAPLKDVPTHEGRAHRHGRHRVREPEPVGEKHGLTTSFSCLQCGGRLRIQLPEVRGQFRCPQCQVEFSVTKADKSPLVFLVTPELRQFSHFNSRASTLRNRGHRGDVHQALAALGLTESASFEDVRRAYRELVQSYHPDKVSHLGPELRQVAENKTKELNSAYQVLETFYGD